MTNLFKQFNTPLSTTNTDIKSSVCCLIFFYFNIDYFNIEDIKNVL